MCLCDYHTHTRFSFDGDPATTHDAMCRRALEVGLQSIAFTDHCDINGEVERLYDCPLDPDGTWNASTPRPPAPCWMPTPTSSSSALSTTSTASPISAS